MVKKILEDIIKKKDNSRENTKNFSTSPLAPLKNNLEKNPQPILNVAENKNTLINKEKKDSSPLIIPSNIPANSNRRYTVYNDTPSNFETENYPKKNNTKYGLWLVAFVSIIFLFFAISFLFTKATITINVKKQDLSINQNFSAVKDSIDNEDLPFALIALEGEQETSQTGTLEEVQKKAVGKVVIYNNFSNLPQKLDIETRLIATNGKIYKTDEKITVPGKINESTPGQIEVGIHATEAGSEYNSGPQDFKILGFKGGPKYDKFFARSKGDISSGMKGKVRSITAEDKNKILDELKDSLQMKLLEKASNQIPEGFILFKDAAFLTVDDQIVDSSIDGVSLSIKIKGTLYGFLFKEKDLTKKIAKMAVRNYDGSDVVIPRVKDFIFSITNKTEAVKDIKNLNFNLTGTSTIIWELDKEKITKELLGKSKSEFKEIFSKYPSVDGADLVLRPIWKNSIPTEIKNVNVILK